MRKLWSFEDIVFSASLLLCCSTNCTWSSVQESPYHSQKAGKYIDISAEIGSLGAWGPVEEWSQWSGAWEDRLSLFKSYFTRCFSRYWTLNMKYAIETIRVSWNGTFVNRAIYVRKLSREGKWVTACSKTDELVASGSQRGITYNHCMSHGDRQIQILLLAQRKKEFCSQRSAFPSGHHPATSCTHS